METRIIPGDVPEDFKRVFIASAILDNFRGKKNVEVQLFRVNYPVAEKENLDPGKLVAKPDASIPSEILEGATEDAALRFLLEAFTLEESEQIAQYLEKKYRDQISVLNIAPVSLPLPFGLGPLSEIPEGERSGFINFDKAPGYDLPFDFKGWYDLNSEE